MDIIVRGYTSGIFFVLSLAFLMFGYMLISRLKKHFKEFHDENRKLLVFATIGLSVPLFLRSIYDLLYISSDAFVTLLSKDEFLTNTSIFVVCDCIPMCL